MSTANSPREGLAVKRCAGEPAGGSGRVSNPPGRSVLEYRIGTRADFLARMLDRLATEAVPDGTGRIRLPLAGLSGSEGDDPGVALLDAWAGVGDVLTFYQERIANEGFLRTARERRSVLELARLAGQELGTGVAASAFLDFTVEDAPGSPLTALVPQGTQVQSIPGQNELPQTFETVESFTAHVEWNALAPRPGRPQTPASLAGATEIYLAGTDLRLTTGDLLLVVTTAAPIPLLPDQTVIQPAIARAAAVAVDTGRQLTRVLLEAPLDLELAPSSLGNATMEVHALREKAAFFGHNALRWGSLPQSGVQRADPYAGDDGGNWDEGRTIWTDSRQIPYDDGTQGAGGETAKPAVYLDRKISNVVEESWAVFAGRGLAFGEPLRHAARIEGHVETTRADYAIVGETTGLALELAPEKDFDLRQTTAWLGSEPLALADRPVVAPYPSAEEDGGLSTLTLDRLVTGLHRGQAMILRGELVGGGTAARLVLLQDVTEDPEDPGNSRLVFKQPLPAGLFVRSTLTLRANVVLATHGETVADVLGSGDASEPSQRFFLRHLPLTYVPAPVPGGRASTLEVRVDGALWQEVDTLAAEDGPTLTYMIEIDDAGRTAVRFGDGRQGARLPTGTENVTAVYRSGVGLSGMVAADTLQLLVTRPLGIREVTNPLPATGGAPPDSLERARADAPVASRTQGKIVSLADFEDFARTFAGVAKVEARPLAGVHLTVAGEGGAAVDRGSALYTNLVQAIQRVRLPGPPLAVSSYERLPFRIAAQLVIDPRFRADEVIGRARAALLDAFAFERRSLGEPVQASDVIAILQGVRGVVALDLDALHLRGEPAAVISPLPAQTARSVGGQVLPSQLLALDAADIDLRTKTT